MTIPEHRKWIINRLLPGKVAYTDEFIKGMEEFIKFACSQPKYLYEKILRCPCKICKNIKHFTPGEVNVHIFKKGFIPGYWYWTSHGEEAPSINLNEHVHSSASISHQGCIFDMSSSSQSNILAEDSEHVNRFDPHKVVIDGIANCIWSKFELARPSWKKFPDSTREMWFDEFKKKLPLKPHWMGDAVFKEMKVYWESNEFKTKSEQNKENRDSNDGASLHTGGCVPHRLIYKRMKEAIGKDPSVLEFYFRTHHKKSDESWVNEKAEATYIGASKLMLCTKFEEESNHKNLLYPVLLCISLSEMDIWVQSVGGKKKGRVKGLVSLGRSVKATNISISTLPKEIDEMIKSQDDASNADLYAQLQNERKKNKRMRKELHLLMKHVYNKSSSNDEPLSQQDYQVYEDDDDSDDVNGSDNPDNVNKSDSDPDDW
ncbi:hypothetical protein BC332_22855 [Capsicum chinense]|nr:hypothetical protein BC332_22855 [Capsicum chinense]